MKNLINKSLECILVLTVIAVLGIFIPLLTSCIITLLTSVTFIQCTETPFFWLVTGLCWIMAGIFVYVVYDDNLNS